MSITVDLNDEKYKTIHPYNIAPFSSHERKVKCDYFPDGIFPGMEEHTSISQSGPVENFRNFAEYLAIMEDETMQIGKVRVLLSNFFYNRDIGWSQKEYVPKEGKVCGYYVDGYIFGKNEYKKVTELLFPSVYLDLIGENNVLKDLKRTMNLGIELNVVDTSGNPEDPLLEEFKLIFPKILKKYGEGQK